VVAKMKASHDKSLLESAIIVFVIVLLEVLKVLELLSLLLEEKDSGSQKELRFLTCTEEEEEESNLLSSSQLLSFFTSFLVNGGST